MVKAFLRENYFAILIAIILFTIPFSWLEPGKVDLGGDASRVYFIDPFSVLTNSTIYGISNGIGTFRPDYYNIPFFIFLTVIRFLISDPGIISSLFNACKLSLGFFFVYLIVKELTHFKDFKGWGQTCGAIITGIFYVLFQPLLNNYDRSLLVHNEVFLNPIIFYLVLRYLHSARLIYPLVVILITTLFAVNFSWAAAPFATAFYSLSGVFFILYKIIYKHELPKLPFVQVILFGLLFLGSHSFHIFPTVTNAFNGGFGVNLGTTTNTSQTLDYFTNVLSYVSPVGNLFASLNTTKPNYLYLLVPFIIISAFFFRPRKYKTFLLLACIFIISFYLVTAKIGDTGVNLYKALFSIPGFIMFRDFVGKWYVAYAFYYSLLFGISLVILFAKLPRKLVMYVSLLLLGGILLQGSTLITGKNVNKKLFETSDLSPVMEIPSDYTQLLTYTSDIPTDQKLIFFPLTDYDYQVFEDNNGGAYVGASPIGLLTTKRDFSGYTHLTPYSDLIYRKIQSGDHESVEKIFGYLNIGYIVLNKDQDLYEEKVRGYPYTYAREYQPTTIKEYQSFIEGFSSDIVYNSQTYTVYSLKQKMPHIWTARNIYFTDNSNELINEDDLPEYAVSVSATRCRQKEELCNLLKNIKTFDNPDITFQKINPTLYKVKIGKITSPIILTFSEAYNKTWVLKSGEKSNSNHKLHSTKYNNVTELSSQQDLDFSLSGGKEIGKHTHFISSGYANSWLLYPEDLQKIESQEIFLEQSERNTFYLSSIISLLSLASVAILSLIQILKFVNEKNT